MKQELSKSKLNYFYHFSNEGINHLHILKDIFVSMTEFNDHLLNDSRLMKLDL